jgi:RNA polymerase sigma factor (sigma-70 family)
MDVDEQEAVALCRRGDPAGLAALARLHQQRALHVAALITRDAQLAEDAVADAFLLAFRRIKTFDQARPFGPWFARVVATTALKALAARRREVPLDAPFEGAGETGAHTVDALADPIAWIARLEDRTAIRAAIRALPPKQRAAIVLKYYADLDEAEIARALGIPRGTVKSRLSHGLSRLRSALAQFCLVPLIGGAR